MKGKKVTWHDPCHAVRYLGVKDQPRRILSSLPGVEFREMVGADRCCGMAGAFSLHYYDLSKKIGDKKAQRIKDTGADSHRLSGRHDSIDRFRQERQLSQEVMHIMEFFF